MANIHLVLLYLHGIALFGGLMCTAQESYICDPDIECQNGGTCRKIGEDDFMCICAENYNGRHCETKTLTEDANWCPVFEDDHYGPCYYQCSTNNDCAEDEICCYSGCGMLCVNSFTGELNPEKSQAVIADFSLYDACLEEWAVCHNGGECYTVFGSFRCDCPPGIFGDHCEINRPRLPPPSERK